MPDLGGGKLRKLVIIVMNVHEAMFKCLPWQPIVPPPAMTLHDVAITARHT